MTSTEIPRKTNKELSELAIDIFSEKVFHSAIKDFEPREIDIAFPIIRLGALDEYKDNFKDIGLIYEYLSRSGQMQCNGIPMFFSCNILHKDDLPIVIKKLGALEKAAKSI